MTTDSVLFGIALGSLLFSMSIGVFIFGGYETAVYVSYYYYQKSLNETEETDVAEESWKRYNLMWINQNYLYTPNAKQIFIFYSSNRWKMLLLKGFYRIYNQTE